MVRKHLCALLLASCFSGTVFAGHKIVFLISTPRSLSTAFLRAIQARGEVDKQYYMSIFNEPFMPVSWWQDEALGGYNRPEAPKTYQMAVDQILTEAERSAVFIKEQSYIVQELLQYDDRLFNNSNVTFAILLRNPHHITISFYKKLGKTFDKFSDLIGQKGCYELWQEIKKRTGKSPVIVITEELYQHPYETMHQFCQSVDIPFIPEALQWKSLGSDFEGTQAWHQTKILSATQHWHDDAIMSTGFQKPREYEVDTQGNPTFSEIENPEDREVCKKAYEENMYYYKLILQSIGE